MALAPCRECGQQVSTEAATCPHCGVGRPARLIATPSLPNFASPPNHSLPDRTKRSAVKGAVAVAIISVILIAMFQWGSSTSSTAARGLAAARFSGRAGY
jgi:hypothetical protein